jgi:peptidoglycan/LPS O-acetylase OafA/YrhL
MFPFNPPAWSLFYELVANFAYAASVKWLTLWRLAVIALIGWLGVVAAVLLMGNLDNGLLPSELPIGLARVGFSFSIGLLLYRTRDRWMQRIPRITMVPALLLTALALAAPVTGGVRISYDLLFVTLIAPGLIMLGAVSVPSTRMHGFAIWLGVISYPLYAIHAPVKHWVAATISAPPLAMMVGTALVVVAASWLVARWYDPPVRDWLTNRLRKPHRADTASPSEHLPLGTERS